MSQTWDILAGYNGNTTQSAASSQHRRSQIFWNSDSFSTITGIGNRDSGRIVNASGTVQGFKAAKARGDLIPFTVLSVQRESVDHWFGQCTGNRVRSFPYYTCEQDYMYNAGAAVSIQRATFSFEEAPSANTDALLQRAYAQAMEGSLMVLVELYEMPKTIDLVRDGVSRTRNRVNHVSQLAGRRVRPSTSTSGLIKAFNETWLEFRYGWMQMVYTSEDVLNAIEALTRPQSDIVSGRAKAVNTAEGELSYLYPLKATGTNPSYSGEAKMTRTDRAAVSMKVSRAAQAFDTNLGAFAWEIVPYSFVVDWFVNMGDLLRAHWPTFSGQPEWVACTSVHKHLSCSVVIEAGPGSNCNLNGQHGNTSGGLIAERQSYDRTPFVGDIPLSLTWQPRFGWKNAIDLIALLPSEKVVANLVKRFSR